MSEFKLIQEILKLSSAKSWDRAKTEWIIEDIFDSDNPETCICGHHPILEVCILRNKITLSQTIVGNCCVKKFIGLPSNEIFTSIKRIKKDINKSVNKQTINYVREKNWISEWEYSFYIDTISKRKMTEKQIRKRTQINQIILNRIKTRMKIKT